MSAKPTEPEPSATPEVVVENLRSAVHASEGELAAQVVADSALDSKLLGLLGFFAVAASILVTVPHGLDHGRWLLLASAGLGALACLAASIGGSTPKTGPLPQDFYAEYGAKIEPEYLRQLLAELTNTIRRNRHSLELRSRALALAVAAPIVLTIAFGLLAIS